MKEWIFLYSLLFVYRKDILFYNPITDANQNDNNDNNDKMQEVICDLKRVFGNVIQSNPKLHLSICGEGVG